MIDAMLAKFKAYKKSYLAHSEDFKEMAVNGQTPHSLVIACADSRIDPAILFNAQLGELFVVRNVANMVLPYQKDAPRNNTAVSIEYAVKHLQVENIIVLGHSDCGGIHALIKMDANGETNEITKWLKPLTALKERVDTNEPISEKLDPCQRIEKASLQQSLDNLRTFPCVQKAIKQNTLSIHGLYFNLAECALETVQSIPESKS